MLCYEEALTKCELPHTVAMIVLDIAAPIFLLLGLSGTTAANASLLNNFEIVATALIALLFFREKISPRLWMGIGFVTVSCAILSFEDITSFSFSGGSLFVLLAAARTSVYYAVAPFIGTALSLVIFRELPRLMFFVALGQWLWAHGSAQRTSR